MLNNYELKKGDFRLREVDNNLKVPFSLGIRAIITSNDVIHCFTVPSFGFKVDAVPGRLNQVFFSVSRAGLFTGGCSEICGSQHSFMPIVIESVNIKSYCEFILSL